MVSQARLRVAKHARMHDSHADHARLAPHDRLMCSQAAARQWSLHTMDINGYTSRGPLHSMVVHAVVQWLPSFYRMCRPRTIARSTSLSACNTFKARLGHQWALMQLSYRESVMELFLLSSPNPPEEGFRWFYSNGAKSSICELTVHSVELLIWFSADLLL